MQVVDGVFLNEGDGVADLVPDYWKPYLSGEIETVPQEDSGECHRVRGRLMRTEVGEITGPCEAHKAGKSAEQGTSVSPSDISSIPYRVGQNVKAPKAVIHPDPEYSVTARALHFEGTSVLELTVAVDGNPTDIVVTRPLGCGLDEQAVAAVKRWKFLPGTLKGLPVATRINVEVTFRLY
jgi:TonB family protein